MSDNRKMELMAMGMDRLSSWCMVVENISSEKEDKIAKLEAKIARLVEVGDKAINAVMDETGFATMCPICRFTDDDQEVMTHSPDCPVTLWNKAKEEL